MTLWQPFPGILQPVLCRAPLDEILPEDDPAKGGKAGKRWVGWPFQFCFTVDITHLSR